MLNESARAYCLLNLAHLRKVAALYGPEEAKKVAAVFKTISLLSFFSASADTLNALAISLARKNLNGNSGAQILAMTSNEFQLTNLQPSPSAPPRRTRSAGSSYRCSELCNRIATCAIELRLAVRRLPDVAGRARDAED